MKASSRIVPLLLILLALASCRKPAGDFMLISAQEAAKNGGVFEFPLLLDDSLAVYSTFLAARLDTGRLPGATFDLVLRITSPGGETAIERVSLPLTSHPDVASVRSEGPVTDFEWPYRDNIRVSGALLGDWKLSVTPADPALMDAILGIGFSYKGKWEKGN